MGKASAPPPVDYQGLSQQDQQNALQLAQFNLQNNRVNQYTPFGSSVWSYNAAGNAQPNWSSTSPPTQYLPPSTGRAHRLDGAGDAPGAGAGAGVGDTGGPAADAGSPGPNDTAGPGGPANGKPGAPPPVGPQYGTPATGPGAASMTPGTWSQTITLSPEQQRLYEAQTRLSQGLADTAQGSLSQVQNSLRQPFSTSGFTPWAQMPQSGTTATSQLPVQSLDMARYQVDPGQIQRMPLPQMAAMQQAVDTAGNGPAIQYNVDTSGVRQLPGNIDDASRRRVEEAIMSRVNPQYQSDEQALRTRLLNSGIEVGTDAYNREMNNFSQRLNDARMQAVLAGGQEESRQAQLQAALQQQEFAQALDKGRFYNDASQLGFGRSVTNAQLAQSAAQINNNNAIQSYLARLQGQGQDFNQQIQSGQYRDTMANNQFMRDLQGANFANNTADTQNQRQLQIDNLVHSMQLQNGQFGDTQRAQQLGEAQYLRQLPLQELNALRSGSQIQSPNFPTYFSANAQGGGNALQAGSLQGRDAMAQYQADSQNNSSTMGTIGSIAAMMAMYF